jgi:hypothetical protein
MHGTAVDEQNCDHSDIGRQADPYGWTKTRTKVHFGFWFRSSIFPDPYNCTEPKNQMPALNVS